MMPRISGKGLGNFVRHPLFRGIPVILETPKKTDLDDVTNLKVVAGLIRIRRRSGMLQTKCLDFPVEATGVIFEMGLDCTNIVRIIFLIKSWQ